MINSGEPWECCFLVARLSCGHSRSLTVPASLALLRGARVELEPLGKEVNQDVTVQDLAAGSLAAQILFFLPGRGHFLPTVKEVSRAEEISFMTAFIGLLRWS